MTKKLSDLSIGSSGVITEVNVSGTIKRRFMDMGLVKGTSIYIEKVAPLGNPIQISLKGYDLCIRLEDAKHIILSV